MTPAIRNSFPSAAMPRPLLEVLGADRRQGRDDRLLSALHLDQVRFAVDIAFVVVGDVEEEPRMLLRGELDPFHGLGEELRVDLAVLLADHLEELDGEIALDAVMVRLVPEFLLEP